MCDWRKKQYFWAKCATKRYYQYTLGAASTRIWSSGESSGDLADNTWRLPVTAWARSYRVRWLCAAMPSNAASMPRIRIPSRRRPAALPSSIFRPPYYDSLVAKLISYGKDRTEAIARMRALDMFVVEGIYTTIPLHQRILADPDFVAGKTDTSYLQNHR
jgi:biotin carboxylase C-terminal domain-containing protein